MSGKRADNLKLQVFFGMIAAGKSYLAKQWAKQTGCSYYNTDVVRKELVGLAAKSSQHSGIGLGIYTREHTRNTYNELLKRAKADFLRPSVKGVVLDGSYGDEAERERLVRAFSHDVDIYFIYCYCAENIIKERLEQRARDPHAVSDGRWSVFAKQKIVFKVPKTIVGARLLELNTAQPVNTLVKEIELFIV